MNERIATIATIKRWCSSAGKAFAVIEALCALAMLMVAVAGVAVVTLPQLLDSLPTEVVLSINATREPTVWVFASAFVQMALVLAMLECSRRLARDIAASETPFREEFCRRLATIAWLLIALAFAPLLDVVTLVDGGHVDAAISGDSLLSGFVVMLVSKIFAYGCVLQAQDDELL